MVIRTADGAKRELFGLFDSSTPIPRPSQWGGMLAHSGERVSMEAAAGLPAFLRGVRLISETAAGLPFVLYRGHGDQRKPVQSAPQFEYLRRPNPDVASPVAMWQFVFASMLGGNAYLYKLKVRRKVKHLYAINPKLVTPKYEGSRVIFELRDTENGPVKREVGKDQIIHIPGILLGDPYVGVSVVQSHRNALGAELGRQRFEGRYIHNDGRPGVVLKHPLSPTKDQRDELRSGFESRHAGAGNAGRVGMLWGGWDIDSLPVSLQDAQFIESKRYSVQDIGRMLGVPSGLLNDPDAPGGDSPEQENMRFLQHGLRPWMDRLEGALASDTDLFPEPDWTVELDDQGFLRADIKTRWDAYRLGRQGGWVTPNEIRAREGLPPVKSGDEIQETPVGGAANAGSASNSSTDTGGGDNADQ